MASSKISELTDGTQFEPGDETIIVRNGANWKVDPKKNSVQAWVNFNGTGTVAIRASYNVSSITDNGTGDYTVNFTNALTDANYAAVGAANQSQNTALCDFALRETQTTSSVAVSAHTTGSFTRVDAEIMNVSVVR